MTKEEIISTAIREAFLCGKEAGEELQRQWENAQQKIDAAKQGPPNFETHKYDGVVNILPQVEIVEENPHSTISELHTTISIAHKEMARLQAENRNLQHQCEEKDATITELRAQLDRLQATVPVGSPTGEEPPSCINFSEGDKVIVNGKFFDECSKTLVGTIRSTDEEGADVLITEPASIFEDANFFVPYEYITKQ